MLKTIIKGSNTGFDEILDASKVKTFAFYVAVIYLFGGVYGITIGLWRAPLQGFYMAIKFPLLIIIMVLMTSISNWILSINLGLRMPYLRFLSLMFLIYSITVVILASLTPILFFILLNTPGLPSKNANTSVAILTLLQIIFIALAGFLSHLRMASYLKITHPGIPSLKIISVWIALNLFIGTQLSWVLRPFIGSPYHPVEFLREHPLKGNFYIDTYTKILDLLR